MSTYDNDIIVRYVEDEMTGEERKLFEIRLREDVALAEEVALCKELKATLQQRLPADAGALALRTTLRDLNAGYFASAARPPTPKPRMISIPVIRLLSGISVAAAIVLVVLLSWPSGTRDYLQKLGRTEMIGTAERGDQGAPFLQQASDYFNKDEFDKALPLLIRAVAADSGNQLALFYKGVTEWHVGSIDTARKDLQAVYKAGSLLQYEAAFYIALSYAGQRNKDAAREWLKKIPEDAPVAAKAKELSGKLE